MTDSLSFDRHYSYDDLTELLRAWARHHPDLMCLESIGKSWQGRDIWLATLTDRASGVDGERPAFLVEANIHAAELTSSFAALHLIQHLLDRYGVDEPVTRLLQTRAVYVVPRLCPDGAEVVLNEGRYVRSSVRPHPSPEREAGLHRCDIDGDGRTLFMRVPDPYGAWKACEADERLLVRREPDEDGGRYFRLLLEGEVIGYDGATVPVCEPYEGLDLGMNYQTDWADFPEQPRSAGPYSGSEPEVSAMMRFVGAHPNITGYVTCHTFGAIHLRPPLNVDEEMPNSDLRIYDEFGAKATSLTGYPVMSYDNLKNEPYRVKGGQISWFYGELGIFAWITEFWNPLRAGGIADYHPSRWLLDHPVEEALRLIRWSDEELSGKGFVDWYPFEHPQLGPVEIGGWDLINYWYNAPFHRIEQEVSPHTQWVIYQALASPLLRVRSLTSERVEADVYRVRLVVANAGFLPTHVSRRALDRKVCGGVRVELALPPGGRILSGPPTADLGQLAGHSHARTSTTWWGHEPGTPDLATVQWLVLAPARSHATVTARHARAGTVRAEVRLEA